MQQQPAAAALFTKKQQAPPRISQQMRGWGLELAQVLFQTQNIIFLIEEKKIRKNYLHYELHRNWLEFCEKSTFWGGSSIIKHHLKNSCLPPPKWKIPHLCGNFGWLYKGERGELQEQEKKKEESRIQRSSSCAVGPLKKEEWIKKNRRREQNDTARGWTQ